jgi:glycogen synthase
VLTSCCRCCAAAEGYSWECQTQEGGWGLDAIVRENNWKLRGIVNGIDYQEWSPDNDVHLTTDGYCQYDIDTIEEGKRQCKVGEGNLRRSQGWSSDRENGGGCACLQSGSRVEHPSSAQDG